jgi:HAD superfamily hydrolase (TIGR01509 family)
MMFSGYIFDVEGTLIDCVPQTLLSIQATLKDWGILTPYETLQLCSGLDGDETLSIVAPRLNPQERKRLKEADGRRYEEFYLPKVKAFTGVRDVFEAIRSEGGTIALATDCKGAPLKHYLSLLAVDDLIDQVACGDDVEKGKPDPELVLLALEKLDLPSARTVMIGDTPYDTQAAIASGVASIGLLSGGFARNALLEAGALDVLEQIGALKSVLAGK